VYGLKQHKFATLVGETTAGAMLSGFPIDLPHGFALFLPVGDYYTADGKRIDMVGVSPNIKVNQAQALEKALELIGKSSK
jgi:C-terminal processing protease CtpA/Prc